MTDKLRDIIARNRAGQRVALPSVCSAHPDVLLASARLAASLGAPLAIEATSNQVNQFGGYTGMRPADFVAYLRKICDRAGLDFGNVVLGGDHLGPQVWRNLPAAVAMGHAAELMRLFVEARFTKIHLDCSEGCAGEPAQVSNMISAERSAALMDICERFAPDREALSYIVGTEVPPPGGARAEEADAAVVPTRPENALATLLAQREAIVAKVSARAWSRVVALVVQPGLEFSGDHIHAFDTDLPSDLSGALHDFPNMTFEAHSTDYQRAEVYPALAARHFAVLKVGPALTFAYRQAVYALDMMADWYDGRPASLRDRMERLMVDDPTQWQRHYHGNGAELRRLRHFGFADRIRYYWDRPEARSAVAALLEFLRGKPKQPCLLSQFFAQSTIDRAIEMQDMKTSWPDALIQAQIQEALLPYFATHNSPAKNCLPKARSA
ncbi:MAG: tagatose 6 phosphate kinase family protein [Cypionkella sp.]|uniref:class II D-tagatose-bisphosphate aldolase non-catalytic subunit n=1 Tax=Cypionkella sp. TaxID=2811411 RepID=UPI0026116BC5|nr:class II D-tagatose-bisphosphate aldolase, non-catalytic subunit [Cypionkella sp.]MDB5659434.1 tagatose 6 phosphate kinase family protein [Cypionkella sp.]